MQVAGGPTQPRNPRQVGSTRDQHSHIDTIASRRRQRFIHRRWREKVGVGNPDSLRCIRQQHLRQPIDPRATRQPRHHTQRCLGTRRVFLRLGHAGGLRRALHRFFWSLDTLWQRSARFLPCLRKGQAQLGGGWTSEADGCVSPRRQAPLGMSRPRIANAQPTDVSDLPVDAQDLAVIALEQSQRIGESQRAKRPDLRARSLELHPQGTTGAQAAQPVEQHIDLDAGFGARSQGVSDLMADAVRPEDVVFEQDEVLRLGNVSQPRREDCRTVA